MNAAKSLATAALLSLLAGQAFAETYRCVRSGNHQIDCTRTDGLTSYQRQMWWYNRKAQQDSAWERREKRSNHEYTGE